MPNSEPLHQVEPVPGLELTFAQQSGLVPSAAGLPVLDAPLLAGAMFGSYRICERIGQGAMGVVYRAEHSLLEKQVALKVMAGGVESSAEARQRFLREAQTAAAIEHAHVVDVTDVGVHEGTPYLVMELLAGVDLERHLGERLRLTEHEALRLLVPIVAAVAAAHDRKIVHRDLKPSNIFLARDGAGAVTPKILDFGISRAPRALANDDLRATSVNELMGSPLYWPPEALQGARELSEKSDQYSLGVVLYECVTGQSPVKGESLFDLLTAIVNGDWPPPRQVQGDVSPALERVIVRAMAREPESRYADLREFGRAMLEVADVRTQLNWEHAFGRPRADTEQGPTSLALQREPAPSEVPVMSTRGPSAWRSRPLHALGLALASAWAVHWALQLPRGASAVQPEPARAMPSVARVEGPALPAVSEIEPPARVPEVSPSSADEPEPPAREIARAEPARRSRKARSTHAKPARSPREAAASAPLAGSLHGANDAPIPE